MYILAYKTLWHWYCASKLQTNLSIKISKHDLSNFIRANAPVCPQTNIYIGVTQPARKCDKNS